MFVAGLKDLSGVKGLGFKFWAVGSADLPQGSRFRALGLGFRVTLNPKP